MTPVILGKKKKKAIQEKESLRFTVLGGQGKKKGNFFFYGFTTLFTPVLYFIVEVSILS